MQRIRLDYAKTQPLRYTSNLDMHKVWERLLRRAALPLAYSQGFNPQPRLNQAAPLPLGMLSEAEVMDFWLKEALPLTQVEETLRQYAQPGIEILHVSEIDLSVPAIQTQTASSEYVAELLNSESEQAAEAATTRLDMDERFVAVLATDTTRLDMDQRIAAVLAADTLPRQRREKKYDLRPYILDIKQQSPSSDLHLRIWMHLTARESATGRADEVLLALGIDPFNTRITRTGLHFL
jgi:hypothetical protein